MLCKGLEALFSQLAGAQQEPLGLRLHVACGAGGGAPELHMDLIRAAMAPAAQSAATAGTGKAGTGKGSGAGADEGTGDKVGLEAAAGCSTGSAGPLRCERSRSQVEEDVGVACKQPEGCGCAKQEVPVRGLPADLGLEAHDCGHPGHTGTGGDRQVTASGPGGPDDAGQSSAQGHGDREAVAGSRLQGPQRTEGTVAAGQFCSEPCGSPTVADAAVAAPGSAGREIASDTAPEQESASSSTAASSCCGEAEDAAAHGRRCRGVAAGTCGRGHSLLLLVPLTLGMDKVRTHLITL